MKYAKVFYSGFLLLHFFFINTTSYSQRVISDKEIAKKIDEYMNAAVKFNQFSGSVLVARNGKPIISKGYGMANYEWDIPNTPKSIFRIGSTTKAITATAIMLLQQSGKLSVEDPLCKYLENCPAAWQKIKIRHLLNHTSGIPDYIPILQKQKERLPVSKNEI